MEQQTYIIEQIKKQGLLPLFYHDSKEVCLSVTRALYDAGIRVIEFTNRGKQAADNFKAMVAAKNDGMKDLLLAVGTIRTAEQASSFIQAGADFLISPVFDADVCDVAYLQKVLWLPGCMTPTEIHVAGNAGCKLVKLFPGNVLGPGFVSAVKELFPDMDFMPTGGVEVSAENMGAWFNAGVCAVGLGSKMISKTVLANKDYATITRLAREALAITAAIKK
ncbi:MAG: bifunctional 4-hydroxy-2-oxoglutarate aldolase/2-dehydro-3-deoxy-phosphogluconate aldolase [Chitinophagaceae bacterium]|nr:bifunctional 4-hydroxy-2-oxoglutarate aldolase/2-dehydro-3-deoxy-phosphogluconate aldolase [Sphingobacteriales bacterium]OJW05120.1 MAG: bifunctional 4-hydroxy-2-oxoglutarate aldolase/2-dehydro-3-deoxy-phosphogluconate aldolase [Sphingobacteriales bacterium 44-61]TXJ25967.1 MAG: bifunctional 4-hydroxy-2-oxoglutarate aldolase/2-dehydro-3-deoxy-phosphogluconate aldolase [Chitinophagaceae bacterium]